MTMTDTTTSPARRTGDQPAPAALVAAGTHTATAPGRAVAAAGLVAVAAIHLADLPSKMSEVPYLGWAYIALIAASLLLADLLVRRRDPRLMLAAAGLSGAVILGFVVNRTVGMPNAMDDIGNWGEPLGMVSLLVEGFLAWIGLSAWMRSRTSAQAR